MPQGDEYINEIQIPESGDITVPYLTPSFPRCRYAPRRTFGARSRQAYRDAKIYTNPNVTVIPEERFVNVGGDVRSPTSVFYTARPDFAGSDQLVPAVSTSTRTSGRYASFAETQKYVVDANMARCRSLGRILPFIRATRFSWPRSPF